MYIFSYTGGRAASRTPLFFFGTVGGLEYEYIIVDIIMYTIVTIDVPFFVYWGGVPPPRPPCFFSARSAGRNTSI